MKYIRYEKADLIQLIKQNVIALCGGEEKDYYVDIPKLSSKVRRRDGKELEIKLWPK